LKRALDLKEILRHLIYVNSLCLQFSMCNLISQGIVAHDLGPRAARPCAPIEHESYTVLEAQTRQSIVVWVIQIPRAPNCPVSARPSGSNGSTTPIIDGRFQLAPAKNEICLVIYPLFEFDTAYRVCISDCSRRRTTRFKSRVDFLVNREDVRQIAHVLQHCAQRLAVEWFQIPAVRQRSDLPICRLKISRRIDDNVVARTTEQIQTPIRAYNP